MDNMRRWQHNCRVHVTAAFQVTPCSLGAVMQIGSRVALLFLARERLGAIQTDSETIRAGNGRRRHNPE